MKKVTAFALWCVLIFSLFVSCAQTNQPQVPDSDTQTQVILQSENQQDTTKSEQTPQTQPQESETSVKEPEKTEQTQTGQAQTEKTPQSPEALPEKSEPAPSIKEQEPQKSSCTIAIYCDTILDNMGSLDKAKQAIVPQDGVILPPTQINIQQGQTVFDALLEATRKNSIHMEFSYTPGYDSTYIEGIGNIYEFDCGDLSGWLYFVNGEGMGVGCDQCEVMPGDEIQWHYTCQLGQDINIKQ